MDIKTVRRISEKIGLQPFYVSKDEKISRLLPQLWNLFGEMMIFKGGTAINRVYISKIGASRFSQDIDLDYFGDENLSDKIENIKKKMAYIQNFRVDGPKLLYRTLRFDCYYINEFGQQDKVKVEIYLSKPPYLKYEKVEVKSPFVEGPTTTFAVYSLEDILVKKMMALSDRIEGRDIYDVFHGMRLNFDKEKLQKSLDMHIKFYKIKGDFYERLIGNLDKAERIAKRIQVSTNHLIPRKLGLRPNWKEMISTLKEELARIFEHSKEMDDEEAEIE